MLYNPAGRAAGNYRGKYFTAIAAKKGLFMRVESFKTSKGLTRYVLVGSSGAPLEPVLHFLRFKDYCGMARNTLKAYCYHLKHYFDYLEAVGTAFEDVGIDELAGFLRWM